MDYKQYEKIIRNIKEQAPIESGVQTLVFMFLHEFFENTDYNLVVIDRLQKKSKYNSYSGISDIAVVSKNFSYRDDCPDNEGIAFCIEVKSIEENLVDHFEQIAGQLYTYKKALITNGLDWWYFDVDKYLETKYQENDIAVAWMGSEFDEFSELIEDVIIEEMKLSCLRSNYAHARNAEVKSTLLEEVKAQEKCVDKKRLVVKEKLDDLDWIREMIDNPIWKVDLTEDMDDTYINRVKYLELIQNICELVKDL